MFRSRVVPWQRGIEAAVTQLQEATLRMDQAYSSGRTEDIVAACEAHTAAIRECVHTSTLLTQVNREIGKAVGPYLYYLEYGTFRSDLIGKDRTELLPVLSSAGIATWEFTFDFALSPEPSLFKAWYGPAEEYPFLGLRLPLHPWGVAWTEPTTEEVSFSKDFELAARKLGHIVTSIPTLRHLQVLDRLESLHQSGMKFPEARICTQEWKCRMDSREWELCERALKNIWEEEPAEARF